MCFIIDQNHSEVKIATEDIVCWKVVFKENGNLFSLYLYFPYKSKRYDLEKKIKIRNSEINKGFHSYSTKEKSDSMKAIFATLECRRVVIIKCTIPKGTEYYYNPVKQEYVSESIIIGKETVILQ